MITNVCHLFNGSQCTDCSCVLQVRTSTKHTERQTQTYMWAHEIQYPHSHWLRSWCCKVRIRLILASICQMMTVDCDVVDGSATAMYGQLLTGINTDTSIASSHYQTQFTHRAHYATLALIITCSCVQVYRRRWVGLCEGRATRQSSDIVGWCGAALTVKRHDSDEIHESRSKHHPCCCCCCYWWWWWWWWWWCCCRCSLNSVVSGCERYRHVSRRRWVDDRCYVCVYQNS